MPRYLQEAIADLDEVSGLREFNRNLSELGSLVSRGQERLRRNERAATLGSPVPPEASFQRDFVIAGRQVQRARQALRTALQSDNWAEIRRSVNPAGAAFGDALSEVRGLWVDGLLEADVTGATAEETVAVFDRISDELRGGGIDGLQAFVDDQLSEFDRILTADRDWGREAHSPLEWWQWLLLAALIASSIFAILACWWWSDCSWVRAALAGACDTIAVIDGLAWLESTCRTILRQIS